VHPAQLDQLWPLNTAIQEENSAEWPKTLVKLGSAYKYFAPRWQALDTALNLQEQIGRERIETRLRELAIYVKLRLQPKMELLTPAHAAMWGPVMSFRVGANSEELAATLAREHDIVVGAVRRDDLNALRISLHIYNSHEDIERILQALQRLRV
jgi:selenocysteine lyase/cysteine desulfurase